jgi:C1A family cysteine protease
VDEGDATVGQLQAVLSELGAPWNADSTSLSELPLEEKRLRLGYVPGPDEPSLAEQEQMALAAVGIPESAAEAVGAPPAYNLDDVGGRSYVAPVRDQDRCGSCVAFGTLATAEGTLRVAQADPDLAVDLSEAHLFYCVARSQGRRCNTGWSVAPALDSLRDIGAPDEACYPYTAGDQDCSDRCTDWQTRATNITGWHELTVASQMKEWISTRGPLVATLAVYADFYSYRSGTYRHVAGDLVGGHCVCAVGYDDPAGCWIIKNSWGVGWGDQGFARIAYGQVAIDSTMWAIDGAVQPRREDGSVWHRGVNVTGVWASADERNAWVYLAGVGWRRLAADSNSAFFALLAHLLAAKSGRRPVNAAEEGGMITQVYVL